MSISEKAAKSLDLLSAALHGLDAIGGVANDHLGGAKKNDVGTALEVIAVISAIVDSIRAGFSAQLDPVAIHEEIVKLRATQLGAIAGADSIVDARFPK